jgi:hypothetical protein
VEIEKLVPDFHFQIPDIPSCSRDKVRQSDQDRSGIGFQLLRKIVVGLDEAVRAVYPDESWIDVSASMDLDSWGNDIQNGHSKTVTRKQLVSPDPNSWTSKELL